MVRKSFVLTLSFFLALLAWAQEPWKSRPYDQWTEQEVEKVLNGSPWVKQIRVPPLWREGRSRAQVPGAATPPDDTFPSQGRARTGLEEQADQERANLAAFQVRWASARPIRQALVRGALLKGKPMTAEAEQYLGNDPEEFEVVILGPDMRPFTGVAQEELLAKTYIRPKKGKVRFAPRQIEFLRQGEGQRLVGIAFYFSKKSATGEAVVAPDEKGIEFSCQTPMVLVRTNFEPQKMADAKGVAL